MVGLMKKHYYGLDFGKIIAAILVVSIHTVPLVKYRGTWIYKLWDIVSSLAVPFFFVCTGFFIGMKLKKDGVELLKKRAISFAKIYLLLTICYLPLTIYKYVIDGESLIKNLLYFFRGLILYGNHGWSWQLWYLLCASYSLFLLYFLYKKEKYIWFITIILFVIGTFLTVRPNIESIIPEMDLFYKVHKMIFWNGRMLLGPVYIWMGIKFNDLKTPRKSVGLIALLICFVLCVFGDDIIWKNMLLVMVFLLFSILVSFEGGDTFGELHFRQASSYIYYIHMYFVFLAQSVFRLNEPRSFLFVAIASVIASYGYIFIRNLIEMRA